jgi:HEAT repeat protein
MKSTKCGLGVLALGLVLISGCAEGMFWKTGYLSPWVRQRWSEEEAIAATLFSRRDKMNRLVETALESGSEKQEEASEYLSLIVANEPIVLLRIEATQLLGDLQTETALQALHVAARDRDIGVRKAAVRSLERMGGDSAGALLADMAASDADIDVRIAATTALGRFRGSTVERTLAGVLEDPNPALQMRAAESLASVTGQAFGSDMRAWQKYLQRLIPDSDSGQTATAEGEPDESGSLVR